MIGKHDIEHYLRHGLRNLWYPVAASWEVGTTPLGLTRLGENIVLWRDGQGRVHALEDRCPHRGARLSKGWNLGDRLACWYHGVEVDAQGVVQDVPAVQACPLVGQACVHIPCRNGMAPSFFISRHPVMTPRPRSCHCQWSWKMASNTATSCAPRRGSAVTNTPSTM